MAKTLGEIIAFVDGIKPNAYEASVKTQWINEIEGTLQTEVFRISTQDITEYDFAEDKDTELIADAPHNKLYWMYLCAMIDFANGEYSKYNNSMAMFNEAYDEYAKWVCRTYSIENHEDTGYCLSAYGIAKKHGFEGTEEEWLASLREASEAAAEVALSAAGSAKEAAESITSHTNNSSIHVSSLDRTKWNGYQSVLCDGGIKGSYLAEDSVTSDKLAEGVIPSKTSYFVNDGEDGADKYATCEYVKNAVDDGIRKSDAMIYKGIVSYQSDLPVCDFEPGWTYKVANAGTYFSVKCEVGDMIIATVGCPTFDLEKSYEAMDHVYYEGIYYRAILPIGAGWGYPPEIPEWETIVEIPFWDVIQCNIDGAVSGPNYSKGNNLAIFANTTGKTIKDSGICIKAEVSDDEHSVPTTSAVHGAIQKIYSDMTENTLTKTSELANDGDGTNKFVTFGDYASTKNHGLVKLDSYYGIQATTAGTAIIVPATESDIDKRSGAYKPITASKIEYAVKSVGDGYYQKEETQVTLEATGVLPLILADNTEFRLSNVTTLTLSYPEGNFECWMSLGFAEEGDITVTLPASSYIGIAPTFGNGETWEMSIKDGVVVASKVGDGT